MKVLICCTSKSWGGLEQVALRDAVALQSKGFDIHVLGPDDCLLMDGCVKNNVKYHKIFCEGKYCNPFLIIQIKNLYLKHKFDIVHIHCFNTIFPLLVGLKNTKASVFATRHIYVEHNKKDFFHKWYLKRLNTLFAISDFARNNLMDMYPLPSEKIKSLYVGIDLNKYKHSHEKAKQFKMKSNIPEDRRIIGIIGRIDNMKGQIEFVEAAKLISESNELVHFVIVGKPTSSDYENYLSQVKHKVAEYKLCSRFTFTGFCDDVSVPLSAMHVFVVPSYFEAFGLTAIEAMACKVPVVMTNRGSIDEIIPDATYGLRVEPRNSVQIAEAVKQLLSNEEERQNIINNACKRVEQLFDQEIYFSKLIENYNSL